jgi:hypothetical protein
VYIAYTTNPVELLAKSSHIQLMYLNRPDVAGSHDKALQYILQLRGPQQLSNEHTFNLWGMTQHCIQGRQLLARQRHLDASPIEWKLLQNRQKADVHILVDAIHITQLCTAVWDLDAATQRVSSLEFLDTYRHNAANLKRRIQQKLHESQGRFDDLLAEVAELRQVRQRGDTSLQPRYGAGRASHMKQRTTVASTTRPAEHKDIWLTCLWNFFAAFQISLREALVTATDICHGGGDIDKDTFALVEYQKRVVNDLATDILAFVTPVLACQEGAMTGRASLMFGLAVLTTARYVAASKRLDAAMQLRRMREDHVLQ